jgi:hypothetical protein
MKTQNKMKTQNNDLSGAEPGDDLEDELRPEYDRSVLKDGVRGKYLAQYRSGTNLVLLDSDVAKVYPTAEAVNEALRRLMQLQEAA